MRRVGGSSEMVWFLWLAWYMMHVEQLIYLGCCYVDAGHVAWEMRWMRRMRWKRGKRGVRREEDVAGAFYLDG